MRIPSREDILARRVIGAVCAEFSVSEEVLVGRAKDREFVIPRQLAMLFLREVGYSTIQAGIIMGKRNHSTVIFACKRIRLLSATNEALAEKAKHIRGVVNART